MRFAWRRGNHHCIREAKNAVHGKHQRKWKKRQEGGEVRSKKCFHSRSPNGRFLRHRPERSERCLNYRKLYQSHGPLPKSQGVPGGPQRKNHVARPGTTLAASISEVEIVMYVGNVGIVVTCHTVKVAFVTCEKARTSEVFRFGVGSRPPCSVR